MGSFSFAVVGRASVGEPTSYDTTVGTFGEQLGRALTDDISKVFQQTGIPAGKGVAGRREGIS